VAVSARDLLAGAGVLLAGVGIALVFESRLAALGVGEAAVMLVGLLALLHGLWLVRDRWDHEVDQATTPDPERPLTAAVPGEEFDQTLGYRVVGEGGRPYRKRVSNRLREVGADVRARYGNDGDADGDGEGGAGGVSRVENEAAEGTSFAGSVRGVFSGETAFQRRIREHVDDLATRAGVATAPLGPVDSQPLPADPAAERDAAQPAVETPAGRATGAGLRRHETRETTRWRGVKGVALLSIGVGIVSKQPSVLLAGVAGLGFAGYAQSGSAGAVDLAVERRLSETRPRPGEEVRVTVEVENAGEETLADLRVVDGVPPALTVVEGSPRMGVALRPGKAARFTYTAVARPGEHEFDPVTVLARDATGAIEQEFTLRESTTLVCLPAMRPAATTPLRPQGTGFAGQVRADAGGGGTEFHTTREYRHGDPLNRIDWNRRARTGELATMEFREERLAKVQVVVDTRAGARYSPPEATLSTLDYSVYAAGRLFTALLNGGNQVGIAAASPARYWLAPGTGDEHRARAREALARDRAFSLTAPDGEFYSLPWLRNLRRRLDGDAQVVVVSSLCDDIGALLARWVEGYGYPVTVVAPDPTGDRTTGQRLARIERALRVAELRAQGVRVVDWEWGEPLDVALLRAAERWQRSG
jgi:uncharacterized repeat protein (TIGR01451 family)